MDKNLSLDTQVRIVIQFQNMEHEVNYFTSADKTLHTRIHGQSVSHHRGGTESMTRSRYIFSSVSLHQTFVSIKQSFHFMIYDCAAINGKKPWKKLNGSPQGEGTCAFVPVPPEGRANGGI